MNPFGNHLLNVIAYLPMVGALIILVAMRESSKQAIARFATAIAGLDLLLALPLWFGWDAAPQDAFGFRFVYEANWIESMGVKYVVGVDGISMLMVLLTTLLGFVAVLASWSGITKKVKQYYAFMLLLQTGMLGVFVSLDGGGNWSVSNAGLTGLSVRALAVEEGSGRLYAGTDGGSRT